MRAGRDVSCPLSQLSRRLNVVHIHETEADTQVIVNPMSLLKNPMILMGIAGLGMVFGMPYLMDNSTLPFQPLFFTIA